MAKSPDNMTPEERLKRIRSLERKVADLDHRLNWAEREQLSTHRWAKEAWAEVRRMHEVCTRHWEEGQAIRIAAGLEPVPSIVPLAKWNPDTSTWEPIDPPATREGDRPVLGNAPPPSSPVHSQEANQPERQP